MCSVSEDQHPDSEIYLKKNREYAIIGIGKPDRTFPKNFQFS